MIETREMRAVVMHGFGSPDVLELTAVEKPTLADDEVLIRTRATTVTAGDCEFRRLDLPLSFRLPVWLYVKLWKGNRVVPGQEVAGEIESVGDDVTRFVPGDQVFAATSFRFGGAAEYVCLPESYPIARIPEPMTVEEAATLPTGGLNAMHFLRSANVEDGDAVLINGAGGSIGTYAVQIAMAWEADVTCVDSGEKLDVLRSLGANYAVDYTREEFTDRGERYDVVVDVVGTSPYSRTLRCLSPGGRYVLGNPTLLGRIRGGWTNLTGERTVISSLAGYAPEDVEALVELVEAGEVRVVVDRRYPLDEIADAHRYVESGRKTGNVVIDVA